MYRPYSRLTDYNNKPNNHVNFNNGMKYRAIRTYSELCQRTFDSKLEARIADSLMLRQNNGEISNLQFQISFLLCKKPNIKIRVDFVYNENGVVKYIEAKGRETSYSRVKRAWAAEKLGINIELVR